MVCKSCGRSTSNTEGYCNMCYDENKKEDNEWNNNFERKNNMSDRFYKAQEKQGRKPKGDNKFIPEQLKIDFVANSYKDKGYYVIGNDDWVKDAREAVTPEQDIPQNPHIADKWNNKGVIILPDIFDKEIPLERSFNEILAEQLVNKAENSIIENKPITDNKLRLYELSPLIEAVIQQAEKHAEENEGELPLELCDIIDNLKLERKQKLIDCALYYKDLSSKKEAIDKEIEKLKSRSDSLKKKSISLLGYIKSNMKYKEKIDDPRFKLTWKKTTKTIITDETILPEGTFELVKKPLISDKIKPLLKDNKQVPGAELKENISLSIK